MQKILSIHVSGILPLIFLFFITAAYASSIDCSKDHVLDKAMNDLLGPDHVKKTTIEKIHFIKDNYSMTPCILEKMGDYYLEVPNIEEALIHYEKALKQGHLPDNMIKVLVVDKHNFFRALEICPQDEKSKTYLYNQQNTIFNYYKKNFTIDDTKILDEGISFFERFKSVYSGYYYPNTNPDKLKKFKNFAKKAKKINQELKKYSIKNKPVTQLQKELAIYTNITNKIKSFMPNTALSKTFQESTKKIERINKTIKKQITDYKFSQLKKNKQKEAFHNHIDFFITNSIIDIEDQTYLENEYREITQMKRLGPILSKWQQYEEDYTKMKKLIKNSIILINHLNEILDYSLTKDDERFKAIIEKRKRRMKENIDDQCFYHYQIVLDGKQATKRLDDHLQERLKHCEMLSNYNKICNHIDFMKINELQCLYKKIIKGLIKIKNMKINNINGFEITVDRLINKSEEKNNLGLTQRIRTYCAQIAYNNSIKAPTFFSQYFWLKLSRNYDKSESSKANAKLKKWEEYVRKLKKLLVKREYVCFIQSLPDQDMKQILKDKDHEFSDALSVLGNITDSLKEKNSIIGNQLEMICQKHHIKNGWHFNHHDPDSDWINGLYAEFRKDIKSAVKYFITCHYKLTRISQNNLYYSSNQALFPGCIHRRSKFNPMENKHVKKKMDIALSKIHSFISTNAFQHFQNNFYSYSNKSFIKKMDTYISKLNNLNKKKSCDSISFQFFDNAIRYSKDKPIIKQLNIPEHENLCGYYTNHFLFNKALACYQEKKEPDRVLIDSLLSLTKHLKEIECTNDKDCLFKVRKGQLNNSYIFNNIKKSIRNHFAYGYIREKQGDRFEIDHHKPYKMNRLDKHKLYCRAFFEDNYYAFFEKRNMKDAFYVFLFEKSIENRELTRLLDCNQIQYNEKEKKTCKKINCDVLKIMNRIVHSIHQLKKNYLQFTPETIKTKLVDLKRNSDMVNKYVSKAIRRELIEIIRIDTIRNEIKNEIIKFVNQEYP